MPGFSRPGHHRFTLTTGTLEVRSDASPETLNALFGIAERRNPKRAFLFVSKVLGRHIPVEPEIMRGVYRRLSAIRACSPGFNRSYVRPLLTPTAPCTKVVTTSFSSV